MGRPPSKDKLRCLVVKMAVENPGLGYTKLQGALANLGHEIGRGTIAETLKQSGLEPALERGKKTTKGRNPENALESLGSYRFLYGGSVDAGRIGPLPCVFRDSTRES